jgi:hypothetical protein
LLHRSYKADILSVANTHLSLGSIEQALEIASY